MLQILYSFIDGKILSVIGHWPDEAERLASSSIFAAIIIIEIKQEKKNVLPAPV